MCAWTEVRPTDGKDSACMRGWMYGVCGSVHCISDQGPHRDLKYGKMKSHRTVVFSHEILFISLLFGQIFVFL